MKLFFREFGTNSQSLIIIHGLFGSSDLWIPFAKELSKSFHIYCPDIRNHGKSPHSDEFNLDVLSNDLVNFIIDNHIKNPIIIGHSLGGRIAMNLALNYQVDIKKLFIIDISPNAYNIEEKQKQLINTIVSINPSKFNSYKDIDDNLSQSIKNSMIRQLIIKNIYKTTDKSFAWKSNIKSIFNNLDKISKKIKYIKPYFGDTLFIKGEKSDYINNENILEIKKQFPKSKITIIKNASHWVHVDAHEKLLNVVINFTKKITLNKLR